jgi:hypothetical protein
MSKLLTDEGTKYNNSKLDFTTDGSRKFFLDGIVGQHGFASDAGRATANDMFEAMRTETNDKLAAAKAKAAEAEKTGSKGPGGGSPPGNPPGAPPAPTQAGPPGAPPANPSAAAPPVDARAQATSEPGEPTKSKFTSAPTEEPGPRGVTTSAIAGHGVGAARVGVDIAEGNYGQAGIDAATQVALTPATYKAAANLAQETGTVAKALGFVGKKIPVVGAVVTAGFVAYEVGADVYHGDYGKAAAAAGAGTAEALGNVVGFGVGDLAREGVREGVVLTAGENYAPDKSGLRSLAERGVEVGSKFLTSDPPAAQEAVVRTNPPAPRLPKPPSLS